MRKSKSRAGFRLLAQKASIAQAASAVTERHADDPHADGSPANSVEGLASSWRSRMKQTPELQNEVTGHKDQPADTTSELDVIIKMVTEPADSSGETGSVEQTGSLSDDDSRNARPLDAGVENDATDIEKESQMQTAAQLKTASDNRNIDNIDLRDTTPVNEKKADDKIAALVEDGMASLFGPVIEDEVKGVRSQIRELIQCELQGELGQRFSRNLRIVIRREIAAAIDDQLDRV